MWPVPCGRTQSVATGSCLVKTVGFVGVVSEMTLQVVATAPCPSGPHEMELRGMRRTGGLTTVADIGQGVRNRTELTEQGHYEGGKKGRQ